MPTQISSQEVQEIAMELPKLLEKRRTLYFKLNRHTNMVLQEEVKEELQVIELKLEKRYNKIEAYYRRLGFR